MMIEVEGLKKIYKSGFVALDDISFEVSKGDFFSLLGPNGAGKSTTMSILTTLSQKSSGKVSLFGVDIEKNSNKIRSQIGVLFQNPSFDETLTVEENIRLNSIAYGLFGFSFSYFWMDKAYKKRLSYLADIFNMQDFLFKRVDTLSGGTKRRFEIIKCLMHSPKLLFLDEPSTGIDPESRSQLWKFLNKARDEMDLTVLFTTHYLDEAENADKICIINKGKIILNSTPKELKAMPKRDYLLLYILEKNSEALTKELEYQNLKFLIISKMQVQVLLEGYLAHDLIKKIKTPLERVDIERPSIEDAYLEILSNINV